METMQTDKSLMQITILELMKVYERRDKNISDAIVVDGQYTKQFAGDVETFFKVRTWYTPEYVNAMTDAEQDAVEAMLDGFDKIGSILHTDDTILLNYEFLVSNSDLRAALGYLLNEENTMQDFKNKYSYLTMAAITKEVGHVEVIYTQLNEIAKAQ